MDLLNLVKKWFEMSQLVLAMLLLQLISAGLQVLSRVVLVNGTFVFALVAYRNLVAAICVAPLAFYFERHQEKKFDRVVCLWMFLSSLAGTLIMSFLYYGLRDTTATYATNFLTMIPIVTFIFSVVIGMEKLNLLTNAGKVKVVGTLVCLAGALTTSLYKGKSFYISHNHHFDSHITPNTSHHHWARGTFFLAGSVVSYSTWFIVQVNLLKVFPFKYLGTMLQCIGLALQSIVVGLCLDRSTSAWKLGFDFQLLTIIYSGALSSAATMCLLTWAISKQGPSYPPMFNAISVIFTALLESLLLGEAITVGILLGMALIIIGLYSFLWGKRNEKKSAMPMKISEQRNSSPDLTKSRSIQIVVSPLRVNNNNNNIEIVHIDEPVKSGPKYTMCMKFIP